MTMAAEFPDVFQLFESPKPKTGKAGIDLQLLVNDFVRNGGSGSDEARNVKRRRGTDPGPTGNRESVANQHGVRRDSVAGLDRREGEASTKTSMSKIHDDHSYSSDTQQPSQPSPITQPTSSPTPIHHSYSSDTQHPSPIPQPTPSPTPPLQEPTLPFSPSLADIDDIFSSLDKTDDASFNLTKAAYGCTWGGSGHICSHKELCPFVRQYLGLSDLSENQLQAVKAVNKENTDNQENVGRIVVMQQTAQGLVKVNQMRNPLGNGGVGPTGAVQLRPESTQLGLDSQGMRSYSVQLRPDQMELLQNINPQIVRQPLQKEQTYKLTQLRQVPNLNSVRGEQLQIPNQGRQQLPTQPNQISMEQLFQYSNGTNQQTIMRNVNASNSNVTIKCPTPSPTFSNPSPVQQFHIPTPSPSPPTSMDQMTSKMTYPCAECTTDFYDSKSLSKHTRNHHQPYTCSTTGCSETTVGYYRMAVHKKAAHRQSPLFACECGRNFAEKKGITKHQNNCKLYKRSAEY